MWSSRRVVIIIVLFMTNGSHGSVGQPARQCQRDNDNFHWDLELSCEGDAKIRIVDAYWGRRQPAVDDAYNVTEGFCPCYGCYGQLPDQRRDQNTHCTTGDPDVDAEITKHVRELVEDKCDNKPSCSIEPKFEELKEPCSDTYKYLEVQYYCSACPTGYFGNNCRNNGRCLAMLIAPQQRVDCGYKHIRKRKCFKRVRNGSKCCFSNKVKDGKNGTVPFCFEPLSTKKWKEWCTANDFMATNDKGCARALADGSTKEECVNVKKEGECRIRNYCWKHGANPCYCFKPVYDEIDWNKID